MPRSTRGLALLLYVGAAFVAHPRAASCQSRGIVVIVRDATTATPIVAALVTLVNAGGQVRTDSSGTARLFGLSRSGDDQLTARKLGYLSHSQPIMIPARDSVVVELLLAARVAPLSGVTISDVVSQVWFTEFDARRRRGTGRYITAEQLGKQYGSDIGSIILRHVPGVSVAGPNPLSQSLFSKRGPNTLGGSCQVAVYIDGRRDPDGNIATVPVGLVGAVEYYTPTLSPVQYRDPAPVNAAGRARGGSAACGVLLIWTR